MAVATRTVDMDSVSLSPDFKAYSMAIVSILGTSNQDFKFDNQSVMTGCSVYFTGIAVADSLRIQIIDKDNVLGHGANYIVNTVVDKLYPVVSIKEVLDFGYPIEIPAGCYFRLAFGSTNILSIIAGKVNIYSHQVVIP